MEWTRKVPLLVSSSRAEEQNKRSVLIPIFIAATVGKRLVTYIGLVEKVDLNVVGSGSLEEAKLKLSDLLDFPPLQITGTKPLPPRYWVFSEDSQQRCITHQNYRFDTMTMTASVPIATAPSI
jgi:hypothetical protein